MTPRLETHNFIQGHDREAELPQELLKLWQSLLFGSNDLPQFFILLWENIMLVT